MVFGQIAASKNINTLIYRCFEDLPDSEQQKFVKSFREQPHGEPQIMHTLMELVCGAYLASKGFKVVHDRNVGNLTPDWIVLNDKSSPEVIIELMNFHIDQETESYIAEQKGKRNVVVYWRDGNRDNVGRLCGRLEEKAKKYSALADSLQVPFIIALHPDFLVSFDIEEVLRCLIPEENGIFNLFPQVSGLLFFEDHGAQYNFQFVGNPKSLRFFSLPSGQYP